MELFSNSTRFCLACNVSTKIIEAIQSRAAILRYSKLTNEQVLECLLKVCAAEKVPYTDDGLVRDFCQINGLLVPLSFISTHVS